MKKINRKFRTSFRAWPKKKKLISNFFSRLRMKGMFEQVTL